MDPKIWHDLLIPDISVVEKIVRTVAVYFFLVLALRLAGKRELAQLNPFDLVVLLVLSNAVQNAIIGNDNSLAGGMLGAVTLLVVNYFVVRFLYSRQRIDHFIEGDEDLLVQNGEIRFDRLKKELIRPAQLEAAARKQGFDTLAEVDKAVLMPGGTLIFVGKKPTPEEVRQDELIARLDRLAEELAQLRAGMNR
ncbi:MAG TPA: YetF domain-containing protein [Thermoanaerobaculia bacterium]|nr:YetF domain-containing protein [Thermoanaerobaculia bacterium]